MRESGANPDAEWVYLPNVEVSGIPHQKNFQPGIAFPQLVLTKAAKHPEKILPWFNWNLTPEGVQYNRLGIEGVNYRIDAGKIITDGFPVKQRYVYSHEIAQEDERYYLQTKFADMKVAIYRACIGDTREREDVGLPLSVYDGFDDYLPNTAKLYREYCSKMVLGELPMSAWDEYVKLWYQRGGTEVTARATAWYRSVHTGK
jgi:putative aldouronate transport system substrate-binding protein